MRAFLYLAALSVASLAMPVAQAQSGSANGEPGREDARLINATQVLEELRAQNDQYIPDMLLDRAYGIAVIPAVVKVGFVFAGRYGKGVLVVRDSEGRFTSPVFISLTGGSVGWQAGAQSTDIVLVFTTRAGVEGITDGKVTLGADASVAAGPVGRQASAATDVTFSSEIYSYSRSRGLFAGVALDGTVLSIDDKANAAYYNRAGVTASDIMTGAVQTQSPNSQRFLAAVRTSTAASGAAPAAGTSGAGGTPVEPREVPAGDGSADLPQEPQTPPGAVKVYPLDPSQPGEAPER